MVPRFHDADYMPNSIMYLEQEIHDSTTQNNDEHYDKIIPYMVYGDGTFVPMLRFTDSEDNSPLLEYYLEYPIFVSSQQYAELSESYHSIYKIFDGYDTRDIQLIAEDSIHAYKGDVVSFEAYLVDTEGYERELDVFTDCYTYDSDTGILTLDSDKYFYFTDEIYTLLEEHSTIQNYDAYIVFDFNIEKYWDISEARDDITSAEIDRIATIQSTHASILEYIYQHAIAIQTQQKLSEITYTVYVTAISSAISLAAPTAAGFAASLAQKGLSVGTIATQAAWHTLKYAFGVASEMFEEVYIDPWIEAYTTQLIADAGGDRFSQILGSCFAESIRETFMSAVTGRISSSFTSVFSKKTTVQTSQQFDTTAQNAITQRQETANQLKADIRPSLKSTLITLGLSSLLMFASPAIGLMGAFGISATTFTSVMDVTSSFKAKEFLKNKILAEQAYGYELSLLYGYTSSEISNPYSILWFQELGKVEDQEGVGLATNIPVVPQEIIKNTFDLTTFHEDTLEMLTSGWIHFKPDDDSLFIPPDLPERDPRLYRTPDQIIKDFITQIKSEAKIFRDLYIRHSQRQKRQSAQIDLKN